jgi:hypothetical protein
MTVVEFGIGNRSHPSTTGRTAKTDSSRIVEVPRDRLTDSETTEQPRQRDSISSRISSERDDAPNFFMTAARWVSTVRWLMPSR